MVVRNCKEHISAITAKASSVDTAPSAGLHLRLHLEAYLKGRFKRSAIQKELVSTR